MRPSRRSIPAFAAHWAKGGPSAVVLFVAIQTGLFAAQWLLGLIEKDRFTAGDWLMSWLALDGHSAEAGEWWRFFSFGLLHAGPLHLLGNLLLLYFAGRELEPIIGRRHVTAMYLGGTLLGGYAHWAAMPEYALVGTSAGTAALIAAYATVLPELEITGHLFFVVPLRFRAKFIALGMLAIAVSCWATLTAPEIGPAGVVAAVVAGWAYTRRLGFGRPFWWKRRIYAKRQRERRLERMDAAQFVAEEIDPILEKIASTGISSLTRAERRLLERGREKMGGG
jgi:membrane associated rhomboid family serine protease